MDIEQTKAYYAALERADICSCAYCQNLIDEISAAYPDVAAFLASLGADIARPFEVLLPSDPADGFMDYPAVQYLICGDSAGFQETKIGEVTIGISDCHPPASYHGAHFIIEAGPFHIPCRDDKYRFDD